MPGSAQALGAGAPAAGGLAAEPSPSMVGCSLSKRACPRLTKVARCWDQTQACGAPRVEMPGVSV